MPNCIRYSISTMLRCTCVPLRSITQVHLSIVDIEYLGLYGIVSSAEEEFVAKERCDEVRKALWKFLYLFGIANRNDEINTEHVNKILRFLCTVDHHDGIKSSTPHGVRQSHGLTESVYIIRADCPSYT